MNRLQEAQEQAAKHHVRWGKVFIAAAVAGGLFLLVPRALPWMSSGVSSTIMGRSFVPSWEFEASQMLVGALHMLVALLYGAIIAPLVFKFNIRPALAIGVFAGGALYLVNMLLFNYVIGNPQTDELAPLATHLLFGAIFTAAYKGMSVPSPRRLINQPV